MTQVHGGPLSGTRIVEIAGIGPGPYACMLLADLGADVLRIARAESATGDTGPDLEFLHRSRPAVAMNLKSPQAIEAIRGFVEQADVFIEGARPGVTERLGLGPDDLLARNPRLVYGRVTGWGQEGPLNLTAGHDINYSALVGALHAVGPAAAPVPPLNIVADFAGGAMFLVMGILAALVERQTSGRGQVVDAAMVDGTASVLTMFYGMMAQGQWVDRRESNILDGGAPFYRTYECADGRFVAVGCIEAKFFAELIDVLGIDFPLEAHLNTARWPELLRRLSDAFATKPRDEWATIFDGSDACVTPVLSLLEAPHHPHLQQRGTFRKTSGSWEPSPAPRFSRSTPAIRENLARPGQRTAEVLSSWGVDAAALDQLITAGAIAVV